MALTNKLTAIGDAIRAKTGESELLTLDEMAAEIADIPAPSPDAQTYMNYAANGLTTISQDADWPVVREYGLCKCNINAQLKNMTTIKENGFYYARINVPQDFSKVVNISNYMFQYATFYVPRDQDTTFSFDTLQNITTSFFFYYTKMDVPGSESTSVNATFDFPNLTSITGKQTFYTLSSNTSYIHNVALNFPLLTTTTGNGIFYQLGAGSTSNTKYIVNLPELTTVTYTPTTDSSGMFASPAYSRYRPICIRAPKLATIKPYMFNNDHLQELILDWNNISEIGLRAFEGGGAEGMIFSTLPNVTAIGIRSFSNYKIYLQDASTTPYIWKIGGAEPVDIGGSAFASFTLYNSDNTYRPLIIDFPGGLTAGTFTKFGIFKSDRYSSPISIVIRNSTVPTLTYSPITSNGIFGGALQPGQQVYVPRALLEDYKAATNWSVIANNIVAIEDYPDLLDQ
jgi:hypothetical protein